MHGRRARVSIIALVLFAVYSLVVVGIAIAGHGHGSTFWVSIVLIVLLAAAAVWLARWIYRRRDARTNS